VRSIILFSAMIVLFSSPAYSGSIVGAEYYFDTDPGQGKGLPLMTKTGVDTLEKEVSIPANLTAGYHYLHLRLADDQGNWGIPRTHLIKVRGTKTVTAAEYYIDADPGPGSGIPLNSGNGHFELSDIDTSTLTVGNHHLHVRMKDSEDNWGPDRKYVFEVSEAPVIRGVEYYFDADPGRGSGTSLVAADGNFDGAAEYVQGEINTSSLETGYHKLYVRATDSYSRWGEAALAAIEARATSNPAISGKITTSLAGWTDLVVKNAEVSLNGTSFKAKTDENGTFILPDVSPGSYTMTVKTADFKTHSQQITWTGQQGLIVDIPPISIGISGIAGDIDGDGKISLIEAIHALQILSGTRQ